VVLQVARPATHTPSAAPAPTRRGDRRDLRRLAGHLRRPVSGSGAAGPRLAGVGQTVAKIMADQGLVARPKRHRRGLSADNDPTRGQIR
jgi:hypothetical protein